MVGRALGVAVLGDFLMVVVVVDEAEAHLVAAHGLDDGPVRGVEVRAVGDHVVEPGDGDVVAVAETEHGEPVLERRVRAGDGDEAGVLGAGQVEDRVGQVVLGHLVDVVDEHAGPAGEADPGAAMGAVRCVDLAEHVIVEVGEHAEVVEVAGRPGTAGQEHVGGRLGPLGFEGERHVVGGAVAGLDGDAGFGGEGFEDGSDEALGAAGVDRDRRVVVAPAASEAGGSGQ